MADYGSIYYNLMPTCLNQNNIHRHIFTIQISTIIIPIFHIHREIEIFILHYPRFNMGKRQGGPQGGSKSKKFKAGGFIDPNTMGVYATCNRHKEQQCRQELLNLFGEKVEEYFDLSAGASDDEEQEEEELSIEQQIEKEVSEMKEAKTSKKELLKPIDLGCECLVFIKTRKPIIPEVLIEKLCNESLNSLIKTTRYTQKLSPVTFSVSPTLDELRKLAKRVLAPHFHQEDQKPHKFAIQISKRNFNALNRNDMIKAIAESVGNDHGHSVDLKNYDKLILVECYKTNIGMSVVNDYLKLERYNLQQIFEKHAEGDETSRVNPKEKANKEKNISEERITEEKKVTEELL